MLYFSLLSLSNVSSHLWIRKDSKKIQGKRCNVCNVISIFDFTFGLRRAFVIYAFIFRQQRFLTDLCTWTLGVKKLVDWPYKWSRNSRWIIERVTVSVRLTYRGRRTGEISDAREKQSLNIRGSIPLSDHCPFRPSIDCRSRFVIETARSEYGFGSSSVDPPIHLVFGSFKLT